MRRANKAEEKRNRQNATNRSRGGRGGGQRGGALGSGYAQDFPPLRPSVERKGDVKFHAANEAKLREMANRTPPHLRVINKKESKGKAADDGDDETEGGVPLLDQNTAARLAALDDIDEYFLI